MPVGADEDAPIVNPEEIEIEIEVQRDLGGLVVRAHELGQLNSEIGFPDERCRIPEVRRDANPK